MNDQRNTLAGAALFSIVLGARAELVLGREGSHPPWRELGTNTGIAGNNDESTGFAQGSVVQAH